MPVATTPEELADLITTTLPGLDRLNFNQIAQELPKYPVMQYWLRKDRVEMEPAGATFRKNLMQRTGNAASFVGVTDADNVGIPTLMSYITVPFRKPSTAWAYNYVTDMLMNRGSQAIIKIIQPRRLGAMLDLAKILEQKAWSLAAVDDELSPWGVPYWITYRDITTAGSMGAFGGERASGTGIPQGYSTVGVGGLTDLTNYKPWNSTYVAVSKSDLFKKMRNGHRQTGWTSPVTKVDQESSLNADLRYYTNSTVVADIEDVGEAQNENLGRDLAPYSGTGFKNDGESLTFRRHPLIWVPQLDDTTIHPTTIASDPIYQIDHSAFTTHCLTGDFNRETGPIMVPDHHNDYRTFVESSLNFAASSRRVHAVYSKANGNDTA